MAIEPIILVPTSTLSATATAIYTAAASAKIVVKRAVFTNIDADPQTFTVYRVPSSGTPVDGNMMIKAFRLLAGESYVVPELTNLVLEGGDSLQALASVADTINVTVSGLSV
jgi:hypothetical protein